jgi:peptidoglycan/xylan/chitin deacetylase (PgdA/CDA1 family)
MNVLVLDNNQELDLNQSNATPKLKSKNFLLASIAGFVIFFLLFGGYAGLVLAQKNQLTVRLEKAVQACQKAQIEYTQEFGQNDISCTSGVADLDQEWSWFELQSRAESEISRIDNVAKPTLEKYQARQSALKTSQDRYNDRRMALKELDYSALPTLESLDQAQPAQTQVDYLLEKTQYFDSQTKLLDQVINRYELLMQYKLDKFWSRVKAAQKLNLELPVEASDLIQEYNLNDTQKADTLILLDNNQTTIKTKNLSNRLTTATLAIMRTIYPKIQESKENEKIANTSDLPKNLVNIPILMYHRVDDLYSLPESEQTSNRKSLTVSPETFSWQMDLIQNKGYKTIDLKDLDIAIETNDKAFFDGKKVILTFDDGYPEHYSFVFKELKKRDMKGVFGIVTSTVKDQVNSSVLTWDNLKEMQTGGMQIVSHTVSHCSLGSFRFSDGRPLSDGGDYRKCDLSSPKEINYGKVGFEMMPVKQAEFELIESKKSLEEKLGQPSPYLIFPFGSYSDQAFDIMWRHGYKLGLGVGMGPNINLNTPFLLNRVTVYGDTKVGEAKGWFEKI